MQDAIRVLAGDCTVTYEATDTRVQRGHVVVLVKPDGTVLVHDAAGYRPAAWLTRADTAAVARDGDGFTVTATRGDERLRVESHAVAGTAHFPASPAGPEVGECSDCGGPLIRARDRVVCADCRADYGLPDGGRVLETTCGDCGLPRLRVARAATVEVCLDYACDPLDSALAARLDGEWRCPDCGTHLAVQRDRGLRLACPDCGRSHPVPVGTVRATCGCGLPRVGTGEGAPCIDPDCERDPVESGDTTDPGRERGTP